MYLATEKPLKLTGELEAEYYDQTGMLGMTVFDKISEHLSILYDVFKKYFHEC